VFLDPIVGRNTGRQIDEQIRASNKHPDVLVTNDMCIAAFVETPIPVVIYTDMMITLDYQERRIPTSKLANLSSLGLGVIRIMFRRAMRRAKQCVFPAEWSANEAVRYGIPRSKVSVVPFGANIDDPGPDSAARRLDRPPTNGRLDVLFIGKDWSHKGGDIALESVELLRSQGVQAVLHVAGECPEHLAGLTYVKPYGFLDKRNASDRQEMDRLYQDCDVLLLPSRREGFGIVAVEAAAYGMPTIAYGVSGLKTAVIHGQTGLLLPEGSDAKDFAVSISSLVDGSSDYRGFVLRARRHFELHGSWDVASTGLVRLIGGGVLN
jgi:glycosyltransferase involved in cell wall biosynthesis